MQKLLIGLFPLIFFWSSLGFVSIVVQFNTSTLDMSWGVRKFVFGIFIFLGVSIIPNLLHLEIYIPKFVPKISIHLSHHPTELKDDHEFKMKDKSICSGCFGSFIGLVINTLLLTLYFFIPSLFNAKWSILFLTLGFTFILISFSRYIFRLDPKVRLIQHAALFLGIGLTMISSDLLFTSAFALILLLPSWVIILLSRVFLSKIDHTNFNSVQSK